MSTTLINMNSAPAEYSTGVVEATRYTDQDVANSFPLLRNSNFKAHITDALKSSCLLHHSIDIMFHV